MALKRFCDWCHKEIENTDPHFYVILSPAEQSVYRGTSYEKKNFEICNACMSRTIEFIKNIEDVNNRKAG